MATCCVRCIEAEDYYYHRFTTLCPGLPRWVSTRRINHSGVCWSRHDGVAVVSAEPYASYLHFAPEDKHDSTSSVRYLRAGCPSWHPTNSVKALKAVEAEDYGKVNGRQLELTVTKFGWMPGFSNRVSSCIRSALKLRPVTTPVTCRTHTQTTHFTVTFTTCLNTCTVITLLYQLLSVSQWQWTSWNSASTSSQCTDCHSHTAHHCMHSDL